MADILTQIAENNQKLYLDRKLNLSLSKMMDMAYAASGSDFAFEKKLKEEGMSFICEWRCPEATMRLKERFVITVCRSYLNVRKHLRQRVSYQKISLIFRSRKTTSAQVLHVSRS